MKKLLLSALTLSALSLCLTMAPHPRPSTPDGTDTTTRAHAGKVIHLGSEQQFQDLISQGNVVVDFYANYCPPCRKLSPIIDELAKGNPDITFVKVDTERFGGLRGSYGIRSIPMLIFFKNGVKVGQRGGFRSRSELQDILNSIF